MTSEQEILNFPEQFSTSKEENSKRKVDKDGFVYPHLPKDKRLKQQMVNSHFAPDIEAVDTNCIDSQQPDSGSDFMVGREDNSQSSFLARNVQSEYFIGQTAETIRENQTSDQTVSDGSQWQDQPSTSAGTRGVDNLPCEAGAATTVAPLKPELELALRTWKEKTDNLLDYWSNIFRLSQEYENKTIEKLDLLLSKAQALDHSTHQQREAVLQRVQGIGQILQHQDK